MTQTAVGVLLSEDGHAWARSLVPGNGRPEVRQRSWATPSGDVAAVQSPRIMVDQEHDHQEVGSVVYLERARATGDLWCVATVSDAVRQVVHVQVGAERVAVAHDLFWSAESAHHPDGIEIRFASLTTSPARVSARPIALLPGELNHRAAADRWQLDPLRRDLLTRAAHYRSDRRHRGDREEPLVVHGGAFAAAAHHTPLGDDRRAHGPLELRSAASYDVHVGRREVDVLVAPAETPTVINEPGGRRYTETIARGAFAECETSRRRIPVNMFHDRHKIIGGAVRLDAWAPEGLAATLRIAKTRNGDEALALVADDCLAVSAGFAVDPDGVEWTRGRQHRRVRKAILDHVALVADPAYDTARITAVRAHALH